MPPATPITWRIFEFPLTVYIPGLKAFPDTKTFMSLIFERVMNASVPIKLELTLDFIILLASSKVRPDKIIGSRFSILLNHLYLSCSFRFRSARQQTVFLNNHHNLICKMDLSLVHLWACMLIDMY